MVKEYVIYYGSILLAAFLGWIAQKYAKDKNEKFRLNKIFWYLSIATLTIVMGFRTIGVGVDDFSYRNIFKQIHSSGILQYFLITKLEIGYVIINYIIGLFTQNFQVVIFITSLIPIILFYKAIEYERKNINFFLAIFLFGTVLFLYFFGITRLFITASIITYALRYVFEKKSKKYIICVLIAASFHYSAIFMLFLLYFSTEKDEKPRSIRSMLIVVMVILPIMLYVFFNFIAPLIGGGKYQGYLSGRTSTVSILDLDKLPFIIIAFMFIKPMYNRNKNIKIYVVMYTVSLIITIVSKEITFRTLFT